MNTRHGWIDPAEQLPSDGRVVLVTTRIAEVREGSYSPETHIWWVDAQPMIIVGWQDMPHPSSLAYAHPPIVSMDAVQLAKLQIVMRRFEEKYTGGYVHITFTNPSMSAGECHYRTAASGPAEGVIAFDPGVQPPPSGYLRGVDSLISSLEALIIHGVSRLARKPTDA
jgi:hypothetical protein